MTDAEIIKALEQFKSVVIIRNDNMDWSISIGDVLNLINRQKAGIEGLLHSVQSLSGHLSSARADAFKEIAKRLKEDLTGWETEPTDEEIEWVIDNLVKEKVGEKQ